MTEALVMTETLIGHSALRSGKQYRSKPAHQLGGKTKTLVLEKKRSISIAAKSAKERKSLGANLDALAEQAAIENDIMNLRRKTEAAQFLAASRANALEASVYDLPLKKSKSSRQISFETFEEDESPAACSSVFATTGNVMDSVVFAKSRSLSREKKGRTHMKRDGNTETRSYKLSRDGMKSLTVEELAQAVNTDNAEVVTGKTDRKGGVKATKSVPKAVRSANGENKRKSTKSAKSMKSAKAALDMM